MEDSQEPLPSADFPPIPINCDSVYFNGYSLAVGAGDVVIALQLNGQPRLVLNTSYTVAKTLAEGLANSISQLEGMTGTTIMTTQDVISAITRHHQGRPE